MESPVGYMQMFLALVAVIVAAVAGTFGISRLYYGLREKIVSTDSAVGEIKRVDRRILRACVRILCKAFRVLNTHDSKIRRLERRVMRLEKKLENSLPKN